MEAVHVYMSHGKDTVTISLPPCDHAIYGDYLSIWEWSSVESLAFQIELIPVVCVFVFTPFAGRDATHLASGKEADGRGAPLSDAPHVGQCVGRSRRRRPYGFV